jgi:tetratricopeptide (TPR) repeat protein
VIGGQPGEIKNELLLLGPVPGKKDAFYVAPPASAIFQATQARLMKMDAIELKFLEANIWLNARRFARADAIYKPLEGKLEKADQGLFWFYWAQTALGLDDFDAYVARLKKAIAAEPKTYEPALGDAYVTVARRYQQRGDNNQYIEFLTKAVNVTPLSAGLHLTLGDAQWQLSNRPAAAAQYKLVLELEPDHADRVRLLNRIREVDAAAPTTQPSAAPK